jgi:hypothetical protein
MTNLSLNYLISRSEQAEKSASLLIFLTPAKDRQKMSPVWMSICVSCSERFPTCWTTTVSMAIMALVLTVLPSASADTSVGASFGGGGGPGASFTASLTSSEEGYCSVEGGSGELENFREPQNITYPEIDMAPPRYHYTSSPQHERSIL